MKFSIIIPAYNEEGAIESIIQRCLDARSVIESNTPVTDTEIIVVNDGSTDSTVEKARRFQDSIHLISHSRNRGYGAAITTGFESATGDLVAFLDADGTCDPNFFSNLITLLIQESADISIGSRMHSNSQMPTVRKIGNKIYAAMINWFGGTQITDSASGMRVILRSSLRKIYPLPDGLHYTPAMSCKAVMDKNIKIVEMPMPYRERIGRSKLSVFRDGVRFARVIMDIILSYMPQKIFGPIGITMMAISIFLGLEPVLFYVEQVPHHLEERMIYRLLAVVVLGLGGLTMILVGVVSSYISELLHEKRHPDKGMIYMLRRIFTQRVMIFGGPFLVIVGFLLNSENLWEYFRTGSITAHWSYVLFGGFLSLFGLQLFSVGILLHMVSILQQHTRFFKSPGKLNQPAWDRPLI